MKRSLFKQLFMSVLFTCSLSADVPVVGQISKRPTSNVQHRTSNVKRPMPVVGLAANWTGAYSFDLYNGSAIRPLSSAVRRPSGAAPDPMAYVLSAAWPLNWPGIARVDRAWVRWDVPPIASPEPVNVPMDPLGAVFCLPRYRMLLALQERASVWETALAQDVAGRSDRKDMAAMILRLKKVFIKEGVPQQWVWMAQIESAFDPRAMSSAGAAGLFQLMPGTAMRFGLQTAPVDDRMEPEKSAGAAAQYLKILHDDFGCWSLALAAYNAGEGRVKEIMKKRNARTFDEVERYLPAETRAYVPKVMAVVALREDRLHGVPGAYWMP